MKLPQHSVKYSFLYFIPIVSVLLLLIFLAASAKYSDFAGYYFGSILLLEGNFQDAYDVFSLNQYIHEQGYSQVFVSYTPFPPFTAALFTPFTFIPIEISKGVFNIFSCLIFLFTLYRSIRYFSISPSALLFIPLVFFIPIKNNLFFGQGYLLLFALLLEGFMAYKKEKYILSSLWWGLAIVFKLFPAIIIFYILVKKEFKQIVYLLSACAFLLLSSLLMSGYEVWKHYLGILPRLNNGELNDSFTFYFQSMFMFLKNIFIYDPLQNQQALYHNPYLFVILLGLFKAFVITVCVMITRKRSSDFLSFSVWIFAGMLISPNGSTYSLLLLLLPFLALLVSEISLKNKILLSILFFLICNIPIHLFQETPLFLKFPRLSLMLTLLALVIYLTRIRISYKILAALSMVFLLMESFKLSKDEDQSAYLLKEEKHILIHNYTLKNNRLEYSYWSEKGSVEEQTTQNISSLENPDDLLIKENQVFYKGNQLTNSNDLKRKPMLADKEYIIYLSDKNRGVGFYTLRKISLP